MSKPRIRLKDYLICWCCLRRMRAGAGKSEGDNQTMLCAECDKELSKPWTCF